MFIHLSALSGLIGVPFGHSALHDAGIADGGGVLRLKVELVGALLDAPLGSYYVGLDQPLANLVIAALEPDTQNSYLANGIVSSAASQARVLLRPEAKMAPLP